MSFTVRELQEQAQRVREHWRGTKTHLSAEGTALLSMVEGLPRCGFVVSRETMERWLRQGLDCQDEIADLLSRSK